MSDPLMLPTLKRVTDPRELRELRGKCMLLMQYAKNNTKPELIKDLKGEIETAGELIKDLNREHWARPTRLSNSHDAWQHSLRSCGAPSWTWTDFVGSGQAQGAHQLQDARGLRSGSQRKNAVTSGGTSHGPGSGRR